MEYIEKIKIGKEAYEKFISTVYYNSIYDLTSIANKYKISLSTVYACITEYRKRVVDPKPTKEQETEYRVKVSSSASNYTNLKTLIKDVLAADTEEKLKAVLKKYSENHILAALKEYAFNVLAEERDESHIIAEERLTQIESMINNNSKKDKNNRYQEIDEMIAKILNDYLNSEEIYPDIFISQSFNRYNSRTFSTYLNSYAKRSKDNNALAEKYAEVKQTRINEFLKSIKRVMDKIKTEKLSSLDIEMLSGFKLDVILRCINKEECEKEFGRSLCTELAKLVKVYLHEYNTVYSKEEAYKINYQYKGVKLNPDNGNHDDIDEVFKFLNKYNLKASLINIQAAFCKVVEFKLEAPHNLKYLYMSKDAFENYIKNQGRQIAISETAKKYGVPTDEIREAIKSYHHRIFSPKPTDSEQKTYLLLKSSSDKKYISEIINSMLNAEHTYELDSILIKYDWVAIKNSVLEYVYISPDSTRNEKQEKVLKAYEYLENKRNMKPESKGKYNLQGNVDAILEEYAESDEYLIEPIAAKYYKAIRSIGLILDNYASKSAENARNLLMHNEIKKSRFKKLADILKEIIPSVIDKTILPLDIQLKTNMDLSKLKTLLHRKELYDNFERKSSLVPLIKYIDMISLDKRKYPEEEVLKIKYNYANKEASVEDLETIIKFLKANKLPLTYTNITNGFIKLVNGTLTKERIFE